MIKVDASKLGREIDYSHYAKEVAQINESIEKRTGAGSDFLGWANYPLTYDKEEFGRILKAAKEIRENMSKFAYWKITLLDERPKKEKVSQMGQFELSHALHGSALSMRVKGRLDSLSASSFLSLFLALSEQSKIESVTIDCKELDYLSSAGFRVLLIMRKECEKGVKLTRVQPSVNSLIKQMGFDAVLEVEE